MVSGYIGHGPEHVLAAIPDESLDVFPTERSFRRGRAVRSLVERGSATRIHVHESYAGVCLRVRLELSRANIQRSSGALAKYFVEVRSYATPLGKRSKGSTRANTSGDGAVPRRSSSVSCLRFEFFDSESITRSSRSVGLFTLVEHTSAVVIAATPRTYVCV